MKSYSTSLMTNTYNVHTHIYTLIHTYTHTLIHSYTHTLIHAYTHTLIQSLTHIYSVRENYNNIILHVCLYMYIGGRSFRAHCTSDLMSLSLSPTLRTVSETCHAILFYLHRGREGGREREGEREYHLCRCNYMYVSLET